MASGRDYDDEYLPPKSDAYTGILMVSLLALIAGCVFLYLDFDAYPNQEPPPPPNISLSSDDTSGGSVGTGRGTGTRPGPGGLGGGGGVMP